MAIPRLATYTVNGALKYGAVTDAGLVDLSARFAKDYPTLREAIAAGALMKLAEEGASLKPDHALDAIAWQPPIPSPEKIICIGVNYPDRNAEYKDGQDAPKYPSMFMRTPRSFVGHNAPLIRPRASAQLDYEGELVLIIGLHCAMKALSATGCATPSSTSRKVRISIPPAALARGWCPTPMRARSLTSI
jgi:2-keto-4-pentenoate hydratase/2-oxohepta-3-ene-1,7-dioic acid hydratase in catechol pathway